MANHKNSEDKFWSFVSVADGGCWEWRGSKWASGYGRFAWHGKSERSHRIAWKLSSRSLEDKDCLLHKCDNRLCCNPEHLFVGTRADNNKDKTLKGRQTKGEDCHSAKLTASDVLAIRSSELTHHEIANLYGVTFGHVEKIRAKKKWKHV